MTDLDSRIVDEFNHRAPFRLEDARVLVLARVGSHSRMEPMCRPPILRRLTTMLTDAKVSIQRIHARHFQGYMGEKRKALVRKYGYDTKNAAHLIRLMRMCNEFLADGELRVYRTTDAWEIRAIKGGEWPLEKAQAEAEMLFAAAKDRKNASPLPDAPDRKTINRLVVGMQREFYDMGKVYA